MLFTPVISFQNSEAFSQKITLKTANISPISPKSAIPTPTHSHLHLPKHTHRNFSNHPVSPLKFLQPVHNMLRTSLPPLEHFSRNPRRFRRNNHIPVLSLLGLTSQSETLPATTRAAPPPLPPLSSYPALKDFDKSAICRLPGAPLRPAEVLQAFSDELVPLELGEILSYREIYYIGLLDAKPYEASHDSDYNDRKKQYTALPNDHVLYRFQILSHAGGGAFSTVYRCFDHKRNSPVALKIIRAKPDCLQFAEVEAKIQGELGGVHAVRLLDAFFWRGHYCLAMELLYADVYTIVEKRNYAKIAPDVVRHVTFQTLLCLRELAKRDIVHADIKPENILTSDADLMDTKVADFGTACYTDQQIFSYIQSRYYRAPEVLYGMRYGPPIDMWSLGCVVYELLSGEPLYPADDEEELSQMIEASIGMPPAEIYKKGTKWRTRRSERRNNAHFDPTQRLAYKLACLPRAISKFITSCLVWDPQERLTPEQGLQHEWIQPEWEIMKNTPPPPKPKEKVSEPLTGRRQPVRRWHNR